MTTPDDTIPKKDVWVMACDIGVKNLAIVFMSFPHDSRRFCQGDVRHLSVVDLGGGGGKKQVVTDEWKIYRNLIHHLTSFDEFFTHHSPYILIEQQMSTKHRTNVQALRLAQHVLAFFLHHHPTLRVIEYPPRKKFQSLCHIFPFTYHNKKRLTLSQQYRERKVWSVTSAQSWLEERHDPVVMDWYNQYSKKDDICDCILMCLAFHSELSTSSL